MVLSGVVCMLYYTTQPKRAYQFNKEELQHNPKRGEDWRKRWFWFFLFYVLLYSGRGACGRCLFLFCIAKRIFFIFCMFFVFFCSVFFCFFLFFLFFLVFFGVFLILFLIFVLQVLNWCFWCFWVLIWYYFLIWTWFI